MPPKIIAFAKANWRVSCDDHFEICCVHSHFLHRLTTEHIQAHEKELSELFMVFILSSPVRSHIFKSGGIALGYCLD